MRQVIGLALTGFGIFLLVTGVLVRFYVVPQVIQAPVDSYQKTTLIAENATYLDASTGQVRTGATLTATSTVRGDARSSHGRIAVWDSFTAVEDLANGKTIEIQHQRVAFDRRTAELTNCCGAAVQGDTDVRQSGIGLFWPIKVTKKSYQLFDTTTRRAWPIGYSGQETIQGIKTYRFVLNIPNTKVPEPARKVPAQLLGLKRKGDVEADRYQQAEITVWVDPRTGAPVHQRRKLLSTLQPTQGPGRLVVADFTLQISDRSQRDLVAKSEDGARKIRALSTTVPLILLFGGLLPIAAGLMVSTKAKRGTRRRRADAGYTGSTG